jgi:hypothetical protein
MTFRSISGSLLCLVTAVSLLASACSARSEGNEATSPPNPRAQVEAALNAFVADLIAHPPTRAELPERIRSYLEAQPAFFGSAVALIDSDGLVTYSPYVYRSNGGLAEKDLAFSRYDINNHQWLAEPRDLKQPIWTDPYFDAGGGEIWMVSRSVPLLSDGRVYAVATTDLPVAAPAD